MKRFSKRNSLSSGFPDAISDIGREFALLALIDEWVLENPQLRLAQELAGAPQQIQGLAASLAELIDGMETEEVSSPAAGSLFD